MPGLGTQPMPRLQKWTRFLTRANLAYQKESLWTRVIYTRMRTQDPTRHRPSSGFPPHPLLGNMKGHHETCPSNHRERQRNVPRRHRGRLDGPQALVKCRKNRTHVKFAAKNMHKCRVLGDISELNTIPVHVCFAISSGVAPIIIGIISRSGMNWKLLSLTRY